jgi:hypothetical protein
MKTTRLIQVACVVAIALAGAAYATSKSASTSQPPDAAPQLTALFTGVEPLMQNRICGEALARLAISGNRGLTGEQTEEQQARRKFAYTLAAEAGLFVIRSEGLNDQEKDAARTSATKIEALDPKEHFAVVTHCTQIVAKWMAEDSVTPLEASKAMGAIDMLMLDEDERQKQTAN